jgi:hypothetical protein
MGQWLVKYKNDNIIIINHIIWFIYPNMTDSTDLRNIQNRVLSSSPRLMYIISGTFGTKNGDFDEDEGAFYFYEDIHSDLSKLNYINTTKCTITTSVVYKYGTHRQP